MKKNQNLAYILATCLLIFIITALTNCKKGSVVPNDVPNATNLDSQDSYHGQIVLKATKTHVAGLIMIYVIEDITKHPLAYGITYHFDDVADKDNPPVTGDYIQFSVHDDGKCYTAKSITKTGEYAININSKLAVSRMLILDDHSKPAFQTLNTSNTSNSHVFGHIDPLIGIASDANNRHYSVHAVKAIINEQGQTDTKYIGIPIFSDIPLGSPPDIPVTSVQSTQRTAPKKQPFYFTLTDIKLKWVETDAKNRDIEPILVREILPYHWHWYDKAVIPQQTQEY